MKFLIRPAALFLIALLLISTGNRVVRADFTAPTVYADTPTSFKATIDVTSFSQKTFNFSSANWKVSVINDYNGSQFTPNSFEVRAQHLVAPHAGESVPNANTVSFQTNAGTEPGSGDGGRTRGPFVMSVTHAPGHVDYLQGGYVPVGPNQSRLFFQVTHTTGQAPPAPAFGTSPFSPKLMVEDNNSSQAAALESVTNRRNPFPFNSWHNFSSDHRTRVSLFAHNAELKPGEDASIIAVLAEIAPGFYIHLPIEFVGTVPGIEWLTQIIVRLPDAVSAGGNVPVHITVRGEASNKAVISITP